MRRVEGNLTVIADPVFAGEVPVAEHCTAEAAEQLTSRDLKITQVELSRLGIGLKEKALQWSREFVQKPQLDPGGPDKVREGGTHKR